jgi:integrase
MGGPEVEAFLNYLASERHLSASSQTQALTALAFLYDSVLRQPLGEMAGLKRVQRLHRVPVVLAREEVKAILDQMTGVVRLMTELIGSGLRVNECMTLRVKDVDFSGGVLNVHSGKGARIAPRCCLNGCMPRSSNRCSGWQNSTSRTCRMAQGWHHSPARLPANIRRLRLRWPGSSCFRLRYCARGVKAGGWRAGMRRIRRYSGPFGMPGIEPGSTSMRACIPCAIPSPLICWHQVPTSGRYSCCSVTAACRRR